MVVNIEMKHWVRSISGISLVQHMLLGKLYLKIKSHLDIVLFSFSNAFTIFHKVPLMALTFSACPALGISAIANMVFQQQVFLAQMSFNVT